MDIYELLDDLVAAVADDATLTTWAQTNYGQKHNVFIDQDKNNPPGESSAPNVQFHFPGKSADEESRIVDYSFGLFIVIFDAGQETRTEDNVTEFTATQKLIGFISRIITVIRAAKPAGFVMAYDWVIDTISSFPNFEADVAIAFREKILIGGDPLG